MVGILEVIGAGATGGITAKILAYLYKRLGGCTGGHVWGDWQDTDHWKITPYHDKDSVLIQRKQEHYCQRDGCAASQSEYHDASPELYAESIQPTLSRTGDLDGAIEVYYECPQCHNKTPTSERETNWRKSTSLDVTEHTRREKCPQCGISYEAHHWNRVPYGEVLNTFTNSDSEGEQ